jgi:predicted SprT family Zn-dependent metalloprotease
MSRQCLCYVCENGMGASKRLAGLLSKLEARNFDNDSQARNFSTELTKQLYSKGVGLNDFQQYGHHLFSVYSRGQNPRLKIIASLGRLGYTPWIRNRQVMVHNKIGWPVLVTDSEIVLLGQSVPRWARILEALPTVQEKPMFSTTKPLGYLKFSVPLDEAQTSFSKLLRTLGFKKESEGLLVSVEDDLELQYKTDGQHMHCTLQQPRSELFLDQRRFDSPTHTTPEVTPTPELPPEPESPREPGVILTKPDQILLKKDNTQVPHIPIPTSLASTYIRIPATGPSQLGILWMRQLWNFLNENKFDKKLQAPNISFIKNIARMRTRGYWRAHGRELKIAARLFNAPLPAFVEIFLHEMCHQAVSEIDKTVDRTQQGHGPHWQRWMRTVGLNPSRYDHNDSDIYLSEEEQRVVKEQREKAEQNKKELELKPEWDLRIGKVVRIALDHGARVVNGVIAYKQTSKYAVVIDPSSGQWWNVPPNLIYKADPSTDQSQFQTDQWVRGINRVQQHFQVKKEVRQIKKGMRTRYGY